MLPALNCPSGSNDVIRLLLDIGACRSRCCISGEGPTRIRCGLVARCAAHVVCQPSWAAPALVSALSFMPRISTAQRKQDCKALGVEYSVRSWPHIENQLISDA